MESSSSDSDTSYSGETSATREASTHSQPAPGSVKIVQIVLTDHTGKELAKLPVCGENEYTQHLTRQHGKRPIFPLRFFHPDKRLQEMQDEFTRALGAGEELFHWMNSLPPKDLCFAEYSLIDGHGCQHFVTNCSFYCNVCAKFIGCKYCHEDSFGFDADPHELEVGQQIKCLVCGEAQDFQEKEDNTCVKCGVKLFEHSCLQCAVSSLNLDFFHCQKCGQCVQGKEEEYFHCDKCGQCVQKTNADKTHAILCGKEQAETCQVCQGMFDLLILKRARLQCPHDIHQACLQNLKQKQRSDQCPSCRMPLVTATESAAEYYKFITIYSMTEIPQHRIGDFVNVKCLQCQEQFVQNWHPKGYICFKCGSISCTEQAKVEAPKEEVEARIQAQYNAIRARGEIPVYPLILFPKENYNEMADMVQDYVKAYEPYWLECRAKMTACPFEMPLRELVNAYCLVRDINEHVGFAALNIVHSRKFFPPQKELCRLAEAVCDAMAEVQEIRRLKLGEK